MATKSADRIEQGLCGPPRVQPLAQHEIEARTWEVILNLRRQTSYPLDAPIEPFFTTMGHHPGLLEGFLALGSEVLKDGALSPRQRELVVLRTGWLCNAPFQWGAHVSKARNVGLGEREIERVKLGSTADGWTAEDALILRAVEELHADSMVAEATWQGLAEWLDPSQLIELTIIVGHYHMTAFLQNSLRICPTFDKDGQPLGQVPWP